MRLRYRVPRTPAAQAGFQGGARVIALALNLVSLAIMLGELGAGGYGEVAIALALIYVVGTLGALGIDPILLRRLSADPQDASSLAEAIVLRWAGGVLAATALAFGSVVLPLDASLRACLLVAAIGVLCAPLQAHIQVLRSRVELVPLAIADVFGSFALLGGLIFASRVGMEPWAAVACTVVSNALSWIPLALLSHCRLPISFARLRPRFARRWLQESRFVWVGDAVVLIYYRADIFLLGALAGTVATGVYGAAYRLVDVAMYAQGILIGAFFPRIARDWADRPALRRTLSVIAEQLLFVATLAFIPAVLVGPPLLVAIGGSDFEDTTTVLALLMAALAVMYLNRLCTQALIAGGFVRAQMFVWVAGLVTFAICSPLIRIFEANGAAVACLVTETVILVMAVRFMRELGGTLSVRTKVLWTVLLAGAVSVASSFADTPVRIAVAVGGLVATGAAAWVLTRGLPRRTAADAHA